MKCGRRGRRVPEGKDMKISVIMPSYNQGRFVEDALRSVIEQDYEDKEILFIDAGSSDETMSVVERYRDEIDYCVSEPDNGQSDAMRKGFGYATGDVMTWLNTDDLLLPGALSEVAQVFAENDGCEWALGNVIWISAEGKILRCRKGDSYWSVLPRLGVFAAYGPSAFFSRELYNKVGGINLDLHYMMDTELWWRFILSDVGFYRLKQYTWALRLHEDAKMSGHMFSSDLNADQYNAKAIERQHIENMTRAYRVGKFEWFGGLAKSLNRISSPRYLFGLYDDWKLRGSKICNIKNKY